MNFFKVAFAMLVTVAYGMEANVRPASIVELKQIETLLNQSTQKGSPVVYSSTEGFQDRFFTHLTPSSEEALFTFLENLSLEVDASSFVNQIYKVELYVGKPLQYLSLGWFVTTYSSLMRLINLGYNADSAIKQVLSKIRNDNQIGSFLRALLKDGVDVTGLTDNFFNATSIHFHYYITNLLAKAENLPGLAQQDAANTLQLLRELVYNEQYELANALAGWYGLDLDDVLKNIDFVPDHPLVKRLYKLYCRDAF